MTPPAIYRSAAGEQAVQSRYDSLLAGWPVPYSSFHIPTQYGETFVVESGSAAAPPLVLLHGAGTNSAMWSGDVAEYNRHYRVLAIDLPGEAGKSAPNRMDWASTAYAEWLDEVLQSLGIEAVTLIGLSQGAWTALKFAVYKPASVTALVVISPGGIVPDKLSFVARALPLTLLGRWGIRRINQLVLGGQSVPPEIEATMTLYMTHFKTRIGALPIFSDAELRRLTMPVQLVIGRRDALRDAEKIVARMQQLVPQLTPTIIPDAGHAVINSRAYILPFLATTAVGQPN